MTVELIIDQPEFLLSDITASDPGVLRLVARNATGDCTPGDIGLYAWTLSPKGTQLQLTATEDACAARRAAFEGEWERSACRNPDNSCLGDLEAGTYKSQFIGPRLDEGEPWTANYGAFSYTVPDGWSNTSDYPDNYVLMRSADYAVATDAKDGTKDLIEVYARPGSALQDATCEPEVKPETGRSVAELISHVIQHPGLTASTPSTDHDRWSRWPDDRRLDRTVMDRALPRCPGPLPHGVHRDRPGHDGLRPRADGPLADRQDADHPARPGRRGCRSSSTSSTRDPANFDALIARRCRSSSR